MFVKRLISGIVLLSITILFVVLGGDVLLGALVLISLVAMMEIYRVFKLNKTILALVGYITAVVYYGLVRFEKPEAIIFLFVAFLLLLMLFMVVKFPEIQLSEISIVYLGLFYTAIMLSYIYKVRVLEEGHLLVWMIFIGAWGSDTCAYCAGMLFGKKKILPKLSPKKTLAGSVGGVVGAGLTGFIFATIFKNQITIVNNPQIVLAIIGAASSFVSQLGDFTASAIKRNHDVKDYGKLIPGHGGILDRFDSIIFTAPIVYFLLRIL